MLSWKTETGSGSRSTRSVAWLQGQGFKDKGLSLKATSKQGASLRPLSRSSPQTICTHIHVHLHRIATFTCEMDAGKVKVFTKCSGQKVSNFMSRMRCDASVKLHTAHLLASENHGVISHTTSNANVLPHPPFLTCFRPLLTPKPLLL